MQLAGLDIVTNAALKRIITNAFSFFLRKKTTLHLLLVLYKSQISSVNPLLLSSDKNQEERTNQPKKGEVFCYFDTANRRHWLSTSPNMDFAKVTARHARTRSFAIARS
jgi:hypothetical protein